MRAATGPDLAIFLNSVFLRLALASVDRLVR